MSHAADLAEASIRIKRWAKAACDAGLVVGGCNPEVSYSALGPVGTRWRVYERLKWANVLADTNVVDETTMRETECCVAAAPTWGELLHKYALWATDPDRVAFFRDRELRGESNAKPPPDPPEWAQHRRDAIAAAQQAGEVTQEWVKRAARGQMERLGLLDPVKFELAWARAEAMGLVAK
jgi:hypothetical protein